MIRLLLLPIQAISWLWSESFWLPGNVTWTSMRYSGPGQQLYIPKAFDLITAILCAVVIHVIRKVLEHWLLIPLGKWHGMRQMTIKLQPNPKLEQAFRKNRRPDLSTISSLSQELNWSSRTIQNWFRRRRNSQKAGALKKFVECGWFLIYYCCAIAYGLAVLWDKDYLWQSRACWIGWPHQHVSTGIYWYYMIALGFYTASLFSIFHDVKRKDFTEMLIHHCITVSLMVLSWCTNFVRIGSLVLILHDIVDPFIHLAKGCGYAGYKAWCDRFFFILFIGWFVTRLVLFPIWILYSTAIESWHELGAFGAYWIFNTFLWLLQLLHIIWFWFISRIAYQAVVYGELQNDTRSDSEMSATDSDSALHANGNGVSKKITEVKKNK